LEVEETDPAEAAAFDPVKLAADLAAEVERPTNSH
jgi:hypothetical protein